MELDRKTIIPLVLIVLVLVAAYVFLRTMHPAVQAPAALVVHHTAAGAEHTYSGDIVLPVCVSLNTTVTVGGPTLAFALTTTPIPGCEVEGEVLQTFSGTMALGSGAPQFVGVTLSGAEIPYTLVEESSAL